MLLKDKKIMPPPWLAFPDIERYSIGWRMGYGEDYIYIDLVIGWIRFHLRNGRNTVPCSQNRSHGRVGGMTRTAARCWYMEISL